MKKTIIAIAIAAGLFGGSLTQLALAGSIKTWSTGETLKASDINANFTHIHALMVGGHGARLVDADVSSSAAIAHSKMQTPALLPKAWAMVSANCTGSTAAGTACTVGDSSQLSITTSGVAGQFRGVLSYTPSNANFAVLVTSRTTTSVCMADTYATTSPYFLVKCFDYAGAAVDTNQFVVLVMDT
jgi:hypothetical protein